MVEKSLCPNCGTVYFPDDQFCSNCGQTVIKPPTEEFKPTEAPPISK